MASISRVDSRSTKAAAGSVVQVVFGSLSLCVALVFVFVQRLLGYLFNFPGRSLNVLLVIFCIVGVWLLDKGVRGIKLSGQFRRLDENLQAGPLSLSQAVSRTGMEEKLLFRQLGTMIARGGFWMSVAVLEDCIVFERDREAKPLMLMADQGMLFTEKKTRGRIPSGIMLGACVGIALTTPFRPLTVLATIAAAFLLYHFSFVLYPKAVPVIRQVKQAEQPEPVITMDDLSGNERADALINEGQKHLRELTSLGVVITDPHIRMRVEEICDSTRQLLGVLKNHPEKHGRARQSVDYVLPNAVKVLHQYDELSSQKVQGENIKEALGKITEMVDMVAEILRRELDALYQDRAMDIEVDLEVMKNMMQQSMDITQNGSEKNGGPVQESGGDGELIL